ncbi:dihydrolipoyl dehydrogenase [Alicyclobacillus sp. ALC3]|uniref:dihydrolipoyl dehydrogenase n=1 Tax=Alicyclobacillus sp. ALC3 TaxID=2796143 RepID=UPI0023792DD9|nr:dihydrolipoyl dehydrogenase [Alicyclobacillus sp. ALC3]WDL97074.1 dihydrolipoyl dehydrogenase [Alicyclobacillus sp. ALC3]
MPNQDLDLVVLGGGTGGYVAAIRAAQLGLKTVVVERDRLGGTCLHRGCIPSKALLKSAQVLNTVKHAADFGVAVSAPEFNLEVAIARKDQVVSTLHKGVQFLMKKHGIEVLQGTGRVMGPSIFSPQAGAVSVELAEGDPIILSPRFTLIATGSRPKPLAGLPFDGKHVVSSDDALQLQTPPKSAIVVGGGAIGVEWASMWSDFGVDVTIVEYMPRLVPGEDPDVSAELARLFKKRKVNVLTGAAVIANTYAETEDGVCLEVETERGRERLLAELVLVAVGRVANVEDIGLEATDVKLTNGVIAVDQSYKTAENSIYAIGDVIGGLQLAHVAAHEGIHAVEGMAGRPAAHLDTLLIPRCTYCRPEVASVGLTETAAIEAGRQVKTGKFSFKGNGKALVEGEADGFVKIIADAETADVIGVHIIGPHATDLISEAGLSLVMNAAPWEIGRTIHPHPTLSEAIGEAALAVDGSAIHGG